MTAGSSPPLVAAQGLTKTYRRGGALGGGGSVRALDGATLEIGAGELLALVGVSGSGKSTLARCLTLHERPDAGELRFSGDDPAALDGERLVDLRRRHQLLSQQPSRAMRRQWSAAEIVAEPLRLAGMGRGERAARVARLLADVELGAEHAARRPHELSGGQRQRVAIARALATAPHLLVLDEGLTGLDLPLRSRLLELLGRLRQRRSLALVVVTHDLRLALAAERVAVMAAGRVVEVAAPRRLLAAPATAAGRALVAAARRLVEAAA